MTKARSLADLMADGNSLSDGVVSVAEVSGAAPLASPSFTGDISVTGTVDGRDVAADGTKLDGVEAGADVTDTANVVGSLTAGSNITIAADGTIAGAAQYTHPTHPGDDASVDTGVLSGATVISDLDFNITTDTDGHVTDANASVATRTLTLTDLGYTGATNANHITNNNQLSNGAGYTTNVGDITNVTAGTNLTGGGSSGSVTVNLTASPNITSLNVGGSEVVSSSRALKNIASVDATTVAAMTAAGVGGSLEFLYETNITSNVSFIDISFPTGYRGFKIAFNQIFRDGTYTFAITLGGQLKDSSGNLITTNNSYVHREFAAAAMFRRTHWQIGTCGPNSASGAANNIGSSIFLTVMNPRDSDVQTSYISRGGGYINQYDATDFVAEAYFGNHLTAQDNSGMRFYHPGLTATITSDSHSYSVWGIK